MKFLVTAVRDDFLVRGYEYFETIWECLVEQGLAKLFMANMRKGIREPWHSSW